jgi:hypothetical protein
MVQQTLPQKRLLYQVTAFLGLAIIVNPEDLGVVQFQGQAGFLGQDLFGRVKSGVLPGDELEAHFLPQETVLGQPDPAPGLLPELPQHHIPLPDYPGVLWGNPLGWSHGNARLDLRESAILHFFDPP